jgi:hypothetical protein
MIKQKLKVYLSMNKNLPYIMKKEFKIFLYNHLKPNFSLLDFWILLEIDDYDLIWNFLLKRGSEGLYNFLLTIKLCYCQIDWNYELNSIEQKVYKNLTSFNNQIIVIKILESILKRCFNEMIKTDLDIINKKNIWVGINLDSLYFIHFSFINMNEISKKKKNPELFKKILTVNLIITALDRLSGVYLYTKLKNKTYPVELINNIRFTKGYIVCFEPMFVEQLKNYRYDRKLINKEPIIIKILKKDIKLIDSIENKNFSSPIWMNNENLSLVDISKEKIFNKDLLYKPSNIGLCVSNLNFLNSIELIYDKNIIRTIVHILSKNTNIDNTLTLKNNLENMIYTINYASDVEIISENSNMKSLIMSASILDLILKQLNYYESFFLDHKLDDRLRVYCYPWPINYQLNHVIRNSLLFKKTINIDEIWTKFQNCKTIQKYLKNINIFEFKDITEVSNLIDEFFLKNNIKSSSYYEDYLKKEYFYQLLLKLSSKISNEAKANFLFSFTYLNDFVNSDVKSTWEYWLTTFKIKKKKLPYLINYYYALKNIYKNDFNNIFWLDASSNAIQLIILRMGLSDEFLLKLVNIIDNDTGYSNIYEYMTKEIINADHNTFLNTISREISNDELISLQDIENNKYMLMPSAYGMGKYSYRLKLDLMISSDEGRMCIWSKIDNKTKTKIADYFWDIGVKTLLKIGFDMEAYKRICKDFCKNNPANAYIWKNDLNVSICPLSLLHSKRQTLLNKINNLKLKLKDKTTENSTLKKELQLLEQKLKLDDKIFWKRTLVKSKNHTIFVRLYYQSKFKIDTKATQQAITPNSIHGYDGCNIHLSLKFCRKTTIEALVIHDSIGCHALCIPLVKAIFKISNIIILEQNKKKKIFPFQHKKTNRQLFKTNIQTKILKSKNFFK